MKSLLHKKSGKKSTNRNEYTSVVLSNEMKKIANYSEEHLVDLYQVYLDEKDASDKYRLIFTLNPVCSNVLFNAITEVVYDEGNDDCFCLGDTQPQGMDKFPNIQSEEPLTRVQAIRDTEYSNDNIMGINYLPGLDIFNNHIIRQNTLNCVMKRSSNTNMSGARDGKIYTIDEEFNITEKSDVVDVFNTIRDYQRTTKGTKIEKKFPGLDATYLQPIKGQPHIYEESEIMDFETTFMNKLKELNGWFGFYNPSTLDIPIGTSVEDKNVELYINKLINNRNSCDFVDMFPDRKRFTFVPQKNKFRENRLEKNWEYCLTYPYKSTECLIEKDGTPKLDSNGNEIVNPIVAEEKDGYRRNGLMFKVITEIVTDSDKRKVIIQSTGAIHNLNPNDTVNLYYLANSDGTYNSGGTFNCATDIVVKGIGDKNGEMQSYYFSIDSDDVPGWFDEEGKLMDGITGRFCKVVFGIECMYYFRVFRRLPNFKEISKDEDRSYYVSKYNKVDYDFNSEINKLAFANNIYGDNIVQIIYLDDVDVNGLTDNLERPLSDIYLTIVKANNGHEKWYPEEGEPDYGSPEITIARAFGKVTSGIDLPPEDGFSKDYNVHRLHNIKYKDLYTKYGDAFTNPMENVDDKDNMVNYKIVENPEDPDDVVANMSPFEDDITIEQEFFLGDLVEFSVSQYQESILEPVYHRFNSAQREYVNPSYKDIIIDEIYMDDYEGSETAITQNDSETIDGNFKCVEDVYNKGYDSDREQNQKVLVTYPGNLFPEGYYYQPHYRIHLKDVSDMITQSSDTQMILTDAGVTINQSGNEVTFTTKYDYDLIVKDEVVIQDPVNNIFYDAVVVGATGVTGETTAVAALSNGDSINIRTNVDGRPIKFLAFKKTLGIPKYAIHFPDTGGKYIWRSLVPHSKTKTDSEIYDKPFANGAHYRHTGINFFLKRQDPLGYYKLNKKNWTSTGEVNRLTNFIPLGRFNENIYYNDALDFGLIDIC